MKAKYIITVILSICLFSFFGSMAKAQPIVKVFLPGHAPFNTTPFYPMLGSGEKNKIGVMRSATEKTDTLSEAIKNKKFSKAVMKFYKEGSDGKPSDLYATLTLNDVTVTIEDDGAPKLKRSDGSIYFIPLMFTCKSMTSDRK